MANMVYEKVTQAIIEVLEKAQHGSWVMPWHRGSQNTAAFGLPINAFSRKAYKGMNVVLCWARPFASQEWATFKQWKANDCSVRKGEKGTLLVKWSEIKPRTKEEEERAKKYGPRLVPFAFYVFNAEQVDGYTPRPVEVPSAPADMTKRLKKADKAIKATGAVIRHGGERACYIPSIDEVYMPKRETFKATKTSTATENYYSTTCHELCHWTGHKDRCNRDFSGRFGDSAYAFEELVAELGAAFLCASLGVSNAPRLDHAQYLATWLKVLRSDDKAIIKAASAAQRAADFIWKED